MSHLSNLYENSGADLLLLFFLHKNNVGKTYIKPRGRSEKVSLTCSFVGSFVFKGRQTLCGEEQEEGEAGRSPDSGLHHHP